MQILLRILIILYCVLLYKLFIIFSELKKTLLTRTLELQQLVDRIEDILNSENIISLIEKLKAFTLEFSNSGLFENINTITNNDFSQLWFIISVLFFLLFPLYSIICSFED